MNTLVNHIINKPDTCFFNTSCSKKQQWGGDLIVIPPAVNQYLIRQDYQDAQI